MNEIEFYISDDLQNSESGGSSEFLLATVGSVTSAGIKLIFDGTSEQSDKVYKCNTVIPFAQGQRVKIRKNSGTYLVEYVVGAPRANYPIPAGGDTGQLLGKNSGSDYAISWITPHWLPAGGEAAQVLVKSSNNDYAVSWDTPHYIPTGGLSGQVLAKNSDSDYDVKWISLPSQPHGIPSGGSSGQVLAKSSGTDYAVSWITQSSLADGNYSVSVAQGGSPTSSTPGSLAPTNTTSYPLSIGSAANPFTGCYIRGSMYIGTRSSDTLGFFGKTPATRQTVANTATVATLITALKAYGLIA